MDALRSWLASFVPMRGQEVAAAVDYALAARGHSSP